MRGRASSHRPISTSATGNHAIQPHIANDTSIRGNAIARIPSSKSNQGLTRIPSTPAQRPASAMSNTVNRIPSGYDSADAQANGRQR